MDEATLTRATEPFFTTKGVGKGTGLGLSMAQGLAEQSGGRLALKSSRGSGTTVEVWLPVAGAETETEMETGAPMEPEPAPKKARKLVVLAVDDDPLVLMNTAAMLEDADHKVIEASSGDEALKVLRQGKHVDLVITDQAMPGMTGIQLVQAIKADWPHLPIIMATGYAELPEGADPDLARLSKPFTQADLTKAVGDVMGRRRMIDRLAGLFRG